jgi:creatinine amidohydrolase
VTFVDLRRLTSPQAAAVDERAIGVVPVGACEQHGPHLPLDTDDLITEALVRDAAGRVAEPIVVAPLIAVGLSDHHAAFAGTVTVGRDTLLALIDAHVAAFGRMGVRRVALLSAHGGNFAALAEAAGAATAAGASGAEVHAYADFARFLRLMAEAGRAAGLDAPETDSHAGAYETSMVLAIAGPDAVAGFAEVEGYVANEAGWLERLANGIEHLSPTGVIGRPAGASAAAGERVLDALAADVAGWLVDTFGLTPAVPAAAGGGAG